MDKNCQLFNLNPDFIDFKNENKIKLSDSNIEFTYTQGNQKINLNSSLIIPYFDIIQDTQNPFKGVSRIKALKKELNLINLSNQANENLIKLSGQIMVSQKPLSNKGDEMQEVSNVMGLNTKTGKTDAEILEEKLHEKGLGQNKQIFVSQFPLDVQAMTKDLVGLEFNSIKDINAKIIYALFNIPQGYLEQSKFNNRDADKLELYESVVIPLANNFQNSINQKYKYKNKIKLSFEHLSFFQEKKRLNEEKLYNQRKLIIEELQKIRDLGFLSDSEFKQKLIQHGII